MMSKLLDVSILSFDLSRAFDCVNLTLEIQLHGISTRSLEMALGLFLQHAES